MSTKDLPHVDLPPDPVIEVYKKDIDREMLRNNLRRTVEERLLELIHTERFSAEVRRNRRRVG
jgi:hypothetical protein